MPVLTKTPNGEDIVILSRQEYDDLIEDNADRALLTAAAARREAGEEEYLTSEEVIEFLAAKTPLAFWRKKRGLTLAALAAQTGVTERILGDIEEGGLVSDPTIMQTIASALHVTPDDLTLEGA